MAPERALDIYGFLEERARRDKELGPDELQGDPHIFWNDVAKHYNVTFSFRDWTYSYTVTENCSQRGCRRKLKFSGFYGNHDYGD
jgi:hypothetical protein